MSKNVKRIFAVLALALLIVGVCASAYAAPADMGRPDGAMDGQAAVTETAEAATDDGTSAKAIAAAIAIGLASAGGAVGMGLAIAKSVEGISRQPEADGKIRTSLMLGLVFVETAIIYALIVAILIIFVL